jgi:hypothetical protein
MRDVSTRIRRAYGAHPLHLLIVLASFALIGYGLVHLAGAPLVTRMGWWFLAAVIGHDLVLFPLAAATDRGLVLVRRLVPTRRRPLVPPLNYVRIPALGTALLLLMFLPGVIRQGARTYLDATGQTQQPFLDRWLLLTAALFAVSAVVYAVRTWRARRAAGR